MSMCNTNNISGMRIEVNGETKNTSQKLLYDILAELEIPGEVHIVNGFQVKENIKIKENDTLVVIEKGKMPSQDKLELMISARHTPQVFEKLKPAKVGIAGLGGIGSNLAIALARTGVGNLILVDFDVVEPSNLNRQNYNMSHLGRLKTEALREQILQINPYLNVEIQNCKVDADNAVKLFAGCQIVCEAFDGPREKAMLVNTILQEAPDTIVVAASGMAGYTSSNVIQTRKKMRRLYVCGDMENEAKQGNGLMAPRVQVCAGHQANMVIRLLLGIEEP